MIIKVKRVYDPAQKQDGTRVLVDRLWPRGISKEKADIAEWRKELAPSKELLSWFHEDKEKRFTEFEKRYRKELSEKTVSFKTKTLTLVTSVKDLDHSHIPTLLAFVSKHS